MILTKKKKKSHDLFCIGCEVRCREDTCRKRAPVDFLDQAIDCPGIHATWPWVMLTKAHVHMIHPPLEKDEIAHANT